METSSFRMPVRVRNVDHPAELEISTVADAVRFLEDWPLNRRGPVHRCALSACQACLAGAMPMEDARRAFESFVRITGLAPPARPATPPLRLRNGGRPALS